MTAPIGSDQIVVDSSGWLEFFTADTKAELFDPYLHGADTSILVPAIVLYEVRKILLLRQTKLAADYFVSEALRHTVVPITQEIALSAAAISIQYKLAMADALVYSTAERFGARLVTSDTGFRDLPGVILL